MVTASYRFMIMVRHTNREHQNHEVSEETYTAYPKIRVLNSPHTQIRDNVKEMYECEANRRKMLKYIKEKTGTGCVRGRYLVPDT